MIARRYAILEAPSILGLTSRGVETLPRVLLDGGLATRLHARHAGRVDPPRYDARRDPQTMLLNPRGIASYAIELANAIGGIRQRGEFPIVLGGDCSIVLGCLLALRRRGRFGLMFVDGHADFYQPEVEPKGEAASMDLALATGRGPRVVTDIEGKRPLVREEDVVVLGRRDAEQAAQYGSQRVEDTAIEVIDLGAVRGAGAEASTRRALTRLASLERDGFWMHLDADVLDDAIMPAVDYRLAGGLRFEELSTLLRTALRSERACGLDVTIFNPALDADGSIASGFTEALITGLGGEGA